jgi:hypothetical protein
MSAALSCEPDEPQGSGLPADAEEGIQQGLYVTLPAEELTLKGSPRTAGPTPRRPARCWP